MPSTIARSVGSLDRKPRSRPCRARAPNNATATVAGSRTGISTHLRAHDARATRRSASATNAADHTAATSRPARPRSCTACGSRVQKQVVRRAVEAALLHRVEEERGCRRRAAAGCRHRPRRALPSRAGSVAGRRTAARRVRATGATPRKATSPALNAAPAAGLFHSAISHAMPEAASSTRNPRFARAARPVATSSSPAATSTVRARVESPGERVGRDRCGRWPQSRRLPRAQPSRRPRGKPQADRPRSEAVLSIQRQDRLHPRPAAARAFDAQPPAERLDPVREAL